MCHSENVNFAKDMRPERYFLGQGRVDYSTLGGDMLYWSGILTSNLGLVYR